MGISCNMHILMSAYMENNMLANSGRNLRPNPMLFSAPQKSHGKSHGNHGRSAIKNHQTRSSPPLCSRGAGLSLLSREICLSMTMEAAAFTRSSASPLMRYLTGVVSAGGHLGCEKKTLGTPWKWLEHGGKWPEPAILPSTLWLNSSNWTVGYWIQFHSPKGKCQVTNSYDHFYHADILTLLFFYHLLVPIYIQEHKTLRFQYLLLVIEPAIKFRHVHNLM